MQGTSGHRKAEDRRRNPESRIQNPAVMKRQREAIALFSIFLIFSLFLLQTSLFAAMAGAEEAVGKFTSIDGPVEVLRGGATPGIPANAGDPVYVKDIIRTKSGSKAEITFNDGNILRLAQRSRMDINEYLSGSKGVIKLPRGKVEAIISKGLAKKIAGAKDANRFEIHTPNAVAGVRGTEYFVYHDRSVTGVVVREGTVVVFNPAFPKNVVSVTAGNMTTVSPQNPPQQPKQASENELKGHAVDTAPEKKEDKSQGGGGEGEGGKGEKGGENGGPGGGGSPTGGGQQGGGPAPEQESLQELASVVKAMAVTQTPEPPKIIKSDLCPDCGKIYVPPTDQDKTPPVIGIYPIKSALTTDKLSAGGLASVGLISNEQAVFGVSVDGSVVPLLSTPVLKQDIAFPVPEGFHTISVIGKDISGNLSVPATYQWFQGSNMYYLDGAVTGDLSGAIITDSSSTTAASAAASEAPAATPKVISALATATDNSGAWEIYGSGAYDKTKPMPATLSLKAGGTGLNVQLVAGSDPKQPATLSKNFSGYWLSDISLKTDGSGGVSGASNLKFLTDSFLGTGAGDIKGSYDDKSGTWSFSDIALGKKPLYSQTPLVFGGALNGGFVVDHASNPDAADRIVNIDSDGFITGLFGGMALNIPTDSSTSAPQAVTFMGTYGNPHGYGVWTTDLQGKIGKTTADGALYGRVGGIALNNNVEGMAVAVYVKSDKTTGYIISQDNFTGNLYPALGMWDAGGNVNAVYMGTTDLNPSDLAGNVKVESHELSVGGGFGEVESISLPKNSSWGVFLGTIEGSVGAGATMSSNWTNIFTTQDVDESGSITGYTIGQANGTQWSDNKLKATMSGRSLSADDLTIITGNMIGTYDNSGNWQAVFAGTEHSDPLSFVSSIGMAGLSSPSGDDGDFSALVGGVKSMWSNDSVAAVMMGAYNPASTQPHVWSTEIAGNNFHDNTKFFTTYDGGAYQGFISGGDVSNSMKANLYAVYVDPSNGAGILKGGLSGTLYPDMKMFEMDGTVGRISIDVPPGGSITAGNLSNSVYRVNFRSDSTTDFTFNDTAVASTAYKFEGGEILGIYDWGVWRGGLSGKLASAPTSDAWGASVSIETPGSIFGTEITGAKFSGSKIEGKTLGYNADMLRNTTSVVVGETLGVFDPVSYTYKVMQSGALIDTMKFLKMASDPTGKGQAQLGKLGIPAVEVGKVTLNGSGNGFSNLAMTDVTFFAPTAGGKPGIWATGDVNGSYNSSPAIGSAIPLSGSTGSINVSTDFTFRQWVPGTGGANGTWLSKITSTPGTTSTVNGFTIGIKGGGAGTFTPGAAGGTIKGTAAGIAK